jgi:Arc/MetJ-type ribon-helix-helix transcriptional regulator
MRLMAYKTFNISFPVDLADELDRKAKEQFGSRSDLLRYAALRYLREEKEFEGLLNYGQELGQKIGYQLPEKVAVAFTAKRRANRSWTNAS